MTFEKLTTLINKEATNNKRSFEQSGNYIQDKIFDLSTKNIIPLIKNIGIIPESISHDSTEEKLYAKVADILLAKAFQELGLSATVNKERANCADVIAKSSIHNYSLVGDAKAFRLSRTAKNQKDFKVKSMVDWKGDNDFAVLVSPYYQYPKSRSQIYAQALDGNVCLLSWEHLIFFLENGIKESKKISLQTIWSISDQLSKIVTIKNKDKNTNFHQTGNDLIKKHLRIDENILDVVLAECRKVIISRGRSEIEFWNSEIKKIRNYTKEQAIRELIKSTKINEKIAAIQKYVDSLSEVS